MIDLQEQSPDRGASQYRSELRATVRALWSGAFDEFQAWEEFQVDINRSFTWAYRQGSAEVGILPADWSPQERQWLAQKIATELSFVDGFIDAIVAGSKANGGKLAPLFSRVELWVQRYLEVYTQGMMTAQTDPKLKWVYDHGADHCSSCLRLNDKTKRKSQWEAAGLQPQSPSLECMRSAGGVVVCKCHFEPTSEPLSRGPLPRA